MKHALLLAGLLALLACKDPFDFAPGDPSKPDPPDPPVLLYPPDGERIDDWSGFNIDVEMGWERVAGAMGYQLEAYFDSVPDPANLVILEDGIYGTSVTVTFPVHHWYYWRVRAVSSSWNWYTDWSELHSFLLPDPAR